MDFTFLTAAERRSQLNIAVPSITWELNTQWVAEP